MTIANISLHCIFNGFPMFFIHVKLKCCAVNYFYLKSSSHPVRLGSIFFSYLRLRKTPHYKNRTDLTINWWTSYHTCTTHEPSYHYTNSTAKIQHTQSETVETEKPGNWKYCGCYTIRIWHYDKMVKILHYL